MAQYGAIVRKFAALFTKAFTDKEGDREKTVPEKDTDYYKLATFLHGLKKRDHVSACLDEYLKVYLSYLPDDRRSKFIFAILLKEKIEKSKDTDKFIDEIANLLADMQRPFAPGIRQRYDDLEPNEQKEIDALIKAKKDLQKQRFGILSALQKAFYRDRTKEPTRKDLWDFDPALSGELRNKFGVAQSRCRTAWAKNDAQDMEKALKEFTDFLSRQNCLELFQVLKWCRDVVQERPTRVFVNSRGEQEVHKPGAHTVLEAEFYFQCVYRVFLYAINHGYSKNYSGFTSDEIPFFFAPLAGDYWYENYVNRYCAGITKGTEFREASVLFLRLLIFARMNDAQLLNNKQALEIRKLVNNVPESVLRLPSFRPDVGPETLRGNVRIKDRFGKVVVIYFDKKVDSRSGKPICVEFDGVDNFLFRISVGKLSDFNEENFYTTLWENTRHLLVLIPAIFQLLGYTFSFVTGGFSALIIDVAVDAGVGAYAEAAKLDEKSTIALMLLTSVATPAIASKFRGLGTPKIDSSMVTDPALARSIAHLPGGEVKAVTQAELQGLAAAEAKGLASTEAKGVALTEAKGIAPAETKLAGQVSDEFLDTAVTSITAEQRGLGKTAADLEDVGTADVSRGGRTRSRDAKLGPGRGSPSTKGTGAKRLRGGDKDVRYRRPPREKAAGSGGRRKPRGGTDRVDVDDAAGAKARSGGEAQPRVTPQSAKPSIKSKSASKPKPTRAAGEAESVAGEAATHRGTKDRGAKERLGREPAKQKLGASELAQQDPGYPAAVQYGQSLFDRFPKLLKSGLKLIKRRLGEPGLWEESIYTGSGRLSFQAKFRVPRKIVRGPRRWLRDTVQLDDIDTQGFVVDTKMRGLDVGREIKPSQTIDTASAIGQGQARKASYEVFPDSEIEKLLGQLQFAKENGLPGVKWYTNFAPLKTEVDRFITHTLTDEERRMVSIEIVERY